MVEDLVLGEKFDKAASIYLRALNPQEQHVIIFRGFLRSANNYIRVMQFRITTSVGKHGYHSKGYVNTHSTRYGNNQWPARSANDSTPQAWSRQQTHQHRKDDRAKHAQDETQEVGDAPDEEEQEENRSIQNAKNGRAVVNQVKHTMDMSRSRSVRGRGGASSLRKQAKCRRRE